MDWQTQVMVRLERIEANQTNHAKESSDWRVRTEEQLRDICDDLHGDKESSVGSRLDAIDAWKARLIGAFAAIMFLTGDGAVSLSKLIKLFAGAGQ